MSDTDLRPLMGRPDAIELYYAFESMLLKHFAQVEVRVSRTQIGFFHGCGFAWAWPPRRKSETGLGITLGLPAQVSSPRILVATEPYPGRWTHHLLLKSAQELDAEFMKWIEDAYCFAAFRCRSKSMR